ncbi:hypothetical protein GcM3_076013 [Golovinomyces cichoracearum]|uniref:Pleckstrin homology domain-containing protein n=1 Tax=Golovinomyces cichoracearum TaxID=62708 RepID=A0A420IQQ7_9PEZI|nr:hypothetical protein GcM3_076013 [Golovinomyces cichoracearum]
MTAWDTEDDFTTAAQKSLPSPSNSSRSAQARIFRKANSPPSSLLSTDSPEQHKETCFTNKENAFSLSPHDYTPSLHANLVSEILALRRAQEAKKKQIESLETVLYETKNEFDVFSAGLASINKENISLKRKLELIENSTSSALLEISKERDNSLETAAEAKQRLEAIQKKVRNQDGEIDRIHALWARDKASWEEEKRKMDRKLHVAENRLKKVVQEVAAFEAHKFNTLAHENETDIEDNSQDKNESDIESSSTRSRASSIRFSMLNGLVRLDGQKTDGLSLADELNHIGVDETCAYTVQDSYASTTAKAQESWRESNDQTCEKCFAAENGPRCSSRVRGRILVTKTQEGVSADEELRAEMNGIVFRDPDTPSLAKSPNDDKSFLADVNLLNNVPKNPKETYSDQTQQREDQASRPNNLVQKNTLKTNPQSSADTTEMQSTEELLNLPKTSISLCCGIPSSTENIQSIKDVLSRSTQTDESTLLPKKSVLPSVIIPSIQLHPPQSTPSSPNEILLSPQFKDKSCQVEILSGVPSKSVSVQTDEIDIGQRINLLPLRPHASSTTSNLPYRNPNQKQPQTILLKTSVPIENNETEKLSEMCSENHNNRSPSNQVYDKESCALSGHISGFKKKCYEDGNVNRPENSVPAIAHQIYVDGSDKPVLEFDDLSTNSLKSGKSYVKNIDHINLSSSINKDKNNEISREKNSVLEIQYSPSSETNSPQADEPPFPIPVRHSSRRPYVTLSYKSDDIDSSEWTHKSPCHRRSKSIRKIRSATVISGRTRTGSFGEASINMAQQPTAHWANNQPITSMSPLPNNDMMSSRKTSGASYEMCNSYTVSGNASNSAKSNSITSDRTTSVISAIAQSMIGEWVFKYTRQRKPASAADSYRSLEISNKVRHRRWIWLAPYERAVMWSSKEPTSRSALMGKCGRKLVIQSVLDVKDENPPPKGINLFDRSILIHSSNRALRFTAVTKESHNNWLKALTFLARSQLLHGPLSSTKDPISNKPQSETRHKTRIHETIRAAKGRPSYVSKLSEVSKKASHSFSDVNHTPSETRCMIVDCDSPADAPIVPRFTERSALNYPNSNVASSFLPLYHRRRSNTAPRNPPSSTHKINNPVPGFNCASSSNVAISAATHENNYAYGYDSYLAPKIVIPANLNNQLYYSHPSLSCNVNQISPNSEDSCPENFNFFDPIGTVRMQAFVSPSTSVLGSDEVPKTEDDVSKNEPYFRCQEPEDKISLKSPGIDQIDINEKSPELKSFADEMFMEKYPENGCIDTYDEKSYPFSGF